MTGRSKNIDSLAMTGGRWTCHDLRRTAATLMAGLGVGTDTINECLNHKLAGVSGVYIQDRRLPQQAQAFEALGAKLTQLREGRPEASNVVLLHAAA
jgi:integrase